MERRTSVSLSNENNENSCISPQRVSDGRNNNNQTTHPLPINHNSQETNANGQEHCRIEYQLRGSSHQHLIWTQKEAQ